MKRLAETELPEGRFVRWKDRKVGWIEAPSGCHVWVGARDGGGYGQVWVDGKAKHVYRVRYEEEIGPIPEGMVLDHFVCSSPVCCNPNHVRPVAQLENALRSDGPTARNKAKTHCHRGHPLSGDNLRESRFRTHGHRYCRKCQMLRNERNKHPNREEANA